MPLPSTIQAYQAQLDFMEKAMEDEKGARMVFLTERQAEKWRFKCNQARVLHREQGKMIYARDHKMWGCSEYDVLEFTLAEDTDGGWWVYGRKQVLDPGRVELLSEVESDDDQAPA